MEKMRRTAVLLFLAALLSAVGCASLSDTLRSMRPKPTYNPSNPIKTIAVLPVLNHTNDVEAPENIRDTFDKELKYMGYNTKPLSEVNRILKDELGITLGKQLDLTTPEELGKKLGVDAVVYGALYDFDEEITGLLNIRRVKVGFKMVIARDMTSENLTQFANLGEMMEKSWIEVLRVSIDIIDAEEKAGKLSKEEAFKAREELKEAYNIQTLDIANLTPPKAKWGLVGTPFWAAGAAVKGITKATGGGVASLVASAASSLSRMSDIGDLKNVKEMSEYPGIQKWIELPEEIIEVKDTAEGVARALTKSIARKTLHKSTGTFLIMESHRAIFEIYRTVPVGPGF